MKALKTRSEPLASRLEFVQKQLINLTKRAKKYKMKGQQGFLPEYAMIYDVTDRYCPQSI